MTFERINDFAYWYKKNEEEDYVLVISLGLIDEDTGEKDARMAVKITSANKPYIKDEEGLKKTVVQDLCDYLGLVEEEDLINIMPLEDSLEIMMQDGYESIEELAEEDVALLQLFGKALPFFEKVGTPVT